MNQGRAAPIASWLLPWIGPALMFGTEPAHAQNSTPSPEGSSAELVLEGDQGFAVALRLLIASEQYSAALDLLDTRPDLAARADTKRLRAQLLVLVGREREALALLESHLTEDSDDALARFQIAEMHFAAERDSPAALAYRLAIAGNLDDLRNSVANARLSQIRDRRKWRVWAGASIAPDSNLNSATDATRVELFGLPFELDDDARRRSGVAFTAFAGVERRVVLDDGLAVRAGLVGAVTDAPGAAFDDAFLSLRAGPDWRLSPQSSLTVQGVVGQRWFGGRLIEVSTGLRAEADFAGAENTTWAGSARIENGDSQINEGRDGWTYAADVGRTHFLGPSSLWRLSSMAAYRDAAAQSETFAQAQVAAGRLFALPFSSLVYVEPYVAGRWYQGPAAAFGVTREDFEYGVSSRFSKRDWVFFGTFPFLALSITHNDSNIALNEFSRERVEIGLTREF
jgi:hypothetical protein